ncbi:11580_t:CDS:1, partial [Ambispora gerdemannii]
MTTKTNATNPRTAPRCLADLKSAGIDIALLLQQMERQQQREHRLIRRLDRYHLQQQ